MRILKESKHNDPCIFDEGGWKLFKPETTDEVKTALSEIQESFDFEIFHYFQDNYIKRKYKTYTDELTVIFQEQSLKNKLSLYLLQNTNSNKAFLIYFTEDDMYFRNAEDNYCTWSEIRKAPKDLHDLLIVDLPTCLYHGCTLLELVNTVLSGNRTRNIDDRLFDESAKDKFKTSGLIKNQNGFHISNAGVLIGLDSDLEQADVLEVPEGVVGIQYLGRKYEKKSIFKSDNETIVLPHSLTALSVGAFQESSVKIVDLTKTQVTKIPEDCFKGCLQLQDVLLPKSIQEIGIHAFVNCHKLNEIELPEGLKRIDTYAFNNSGLSFIEIPESVEFLGSRAFKSCNYLTTVILPTQIPNVEKEIFIDCKRLKRVENYEALAKSAGAFNGCTKFKAADDLRLQKKVLKPEDFKDVVLGELVLSEKTRAISSDCFESTTGLVSLTASANLEYIGERAFNCCEDLEFVDLSQCTKLKIGANAFLHCKKLKVVKLPNSLRSIPAQCFYDCKSLTEFNWPTNLRFIGKHAFVQTGIQSVVFPERLSQIGKGAFYNCEQLKSVELSKGITYLPDEAFACCKNLDKVIITDQLSIIDSEAFQSCTSLTEVEVKNSSSDFDQFEDIVYAVDSFNSCPYKEVLLAADVLFTNDVSKYEESYRRSRRIF